MAESDVYFILIQVLRQLHFLNDFLYFKFNGKLVATLGYQLITKAPLADLQFPSFTGLFEIGIFLNALDDKQVIDVPVSNKLASKVIP